MINLLFVATLVFVVTLWRMPIIVFSLLTATRISIMFLTGWRYWKEYTICAVAGSLCEVIAISAGAWEYSNAQFLGIPIWLPLAWGSAGVFFVLLNKKLTKHK